MQSIREYVCRAARVARFRLLYTSTDNSQRLFSSTTPDIIKPPKSLNHEQLRKSTVLSRYLLLPNTSGTNAVPNDAAPPTIRPSPASNMCQTMAFSYSLFYKNTFLDEKTLAKSVQRLVTELPVLSGRVKPPTRPKGIKTLGETELEMNNAGVEFVVAGSDRFHIQDLGPHSWTTGLSGKTLTDFTIPFYAEPVNVDALLQGKEPLIKVKLMKCRDGTIVSLTCSHILADAGRAVKLAERLGALYQSETTGKSAGLPLQFTPELETPEGFAAALTEQKPRPGPPAPNHLMTARQWLAAPYRMYRHAADKFDVHIVHLPASATKRLKTLVVGTETNARISTNDCVQAFLTTLKCSLRDWPLVPTAPTELTVNVDLLHKDIPFRSPEKLQYHLGNAVSILHVTGVQPGTSIPSYNKTDSDGHIANTFINALRMNARLIRKSVSDFRSDSRNVLVALERQAVLSSLPELRMAASFVVKAADMKSGSSTSTTAFSFDSIDFGFGAPVYSQINYQPRFDWWSIIQSAPAPNDGVICSMTVAHGLQNKLVEHPVWRLLVPEAKLIVADAEIEEKRERSTRAKTASSVNGSKTVERFAVESGTLGKSPQPDKPKWFDYQVVESYSSKGL